MNRIIFALSLFLFISCSTYFEAETITFKKTTNSIGLNLIDSTQLNYNEFLFPHNILGMRIDEKNNTCILKLIDKTVPWNSPKNGYCVYADIAHDSILWSKSLNTNKSYILEAQKNIVITHPLGSMAFNKNDGTLNWESDIQFYIKWNEIGVGHKINFISGKTDQLTGVDLNTNKVVWERTIDGDLDIKNMTNINDSTILIITDGLHTLNPFNGKGWDYEASTTAQHTEEKDFKGIKSNTLVEKNAIYQSTKNKIFKLDVKTGKTIWEYPNVETMSSSSSILIHDSLLFQINKGTVKVNSETIIHGKPYLACYNKYSGERLYMELFFEEEDYIIDFIEKNNKIHLLFLNKLVSVSMKEGTIVKETDTQTNLYSKNDHFLRTAVGYEDSGKITVMSVNKNDISIYKDNKNVLELDSNNKPVQLFNTEWIYTFKGDFLGFNIFERDLNTFIVNKKNEIVAKFDFILNKKTAIDKIFLMGRKKIIVFSIEDFRKFLGLSMARDVNKIVVIN